ncbi:MAG: V-type ATP synthase subunit I [Oscillospiraceae bacterium]
MIVKMMKLSALCQKENSREVIKQLYSLGCVELESASPELLHEAGENLSLQEENTDSAAIKGKITAAISNLDKYSPHKVSFFAPRDPITEKKLFESNSLEEGIAAAEKINALSALAEENLTAVAKAENRIVSLTPWRDLSVPCEITKTQSTLFLRGVIPAENDMDKLLASLREDFLDFQPTVLGVDREQYYVTFLVHEKIAEDFISKIKAVGFVNAPLNDLTGTVSDNIKELQKQILGLRAKNTELTQQIKALAPCRGKISAAFDAFSQESQKDLLMSTFGRTQRTVLLNGWIPLDCCDEVGKLFSQLGCAWEFTEPSPEENIPVTYKNNPFTAPFEGITKMYGTPTYGSMIDPNPLMSIFFFTFFGFMMGDAMYGILITLGAYIFLKLKRPQGSFKETIKMFMYCGISTFVAGVLTGSWFGDSVAAISAWITGTAVVLPPLWFDPLANPMQMLVFSLALGGIQIFTGMAVSAYRMIRQGHPMDAVFDIGSWWVLFAGVGMFALKIPAGTYFIIAGFLALLLTGGRKNKGLGKITGGLGSIYNITGFISDLLSYSRIMALGLSGAVVGQVVNKIATMANGILGIILFLLVFVGGHIFNIAISLLGAYVHASRLQYIEFFGRFFEDGGRAFKPLFNNTKYVEIIKEEN